MGEAGSVECEVLAPPGDPRVSMVWLHGMGQDTDSLRSKAEQMGLVEAGVRSVFPRAPQLMTSALTGRAVRAWFPMKVLTFNGAELSDLLRIEVQLRSIVDREIELVGTPHRVLLAGFSQGATMALRLGTRYPRRLGGLLLYAPFMILNESLFSPYRSWKATEPVWIGHGARDLVVPTRLATDVRNMLRGHGYRVYWNVYPCGHEPFGEVFTDRRLTTFMDTLLGRLAKNGADS